jgi:hypothetical protein
MFEQMILMEQAPSPEGDSAAGSGESTKPTLPSDDMEIELASGDIVTFGEIKSGYSRTADYTVKTQEAAEMKRQADVATVDAAAATAEAANDSARAQELRDAVQADLVWYNTHDQSQWAGYTAEVDKAMGVNYSAPAAAPVAPTADPRDAKIAEQDARINALEGTNVKTANEKLVDTALDSIEATAGSQGHELVTSKLLLKSVQAHQAQNNGNLPNAAEIAKYSTELQTELVNMGVPVPRGNVGPNGSTKPRPAGDVAADVQPAWKELNIKKDRVKVEEALGNILREKAAARG